LDAIDINIIFYLLARDNVDEVIKDELVCRPLHLLKIAKAAPLSAERDARWQIADALGHVDAIDHDVEQLLEPLLQDLDKYVSRRALMALTRRKSTSLDVWAVRAWDTGHEYQRMAALEALEAKASPLLIPYLNQAENDGRKYLVRLAREIRDRGIRV
jgi:HEAT repeat protein